MKIEVDCMRLSFGNSKPYTSLQVGGSDSATRA